jgi:hypothetical protein
MKVSQSDNPNEERQNTMIDFHPCWSTETAEPRVQEAPVGRVILRLDRTGEFDVKAFGDVSRKCGAPGAMRMGYHVQVFCGPRLDEDGFLIDHNVLHRHFVDTYQEEGVLAFPSCEIIAMRAVAAIRRLCVEHGTDLDRVVVRIATAPLTPTSGVTVEWTSSTSALA